MTAPFLVFILIAIGSMASAENGLSLKSNCYDAARAASYIKSFNVKTSDFNYSKELCNPKNELLPIFEAFDFIRSIAFDQDGARAVIPGIVGTGYFEYLKKNIKRVVKETHADADGSMDPDTGEMAIGTGYIKNPDLVERSGILVHEARHAAKVKDGYSHIKCRAGEFKGEEACDPSFAAQGSYAVEVEFFARIYYSANNVGSDVKEAARKSALETIKENFNEQDISF